MGAEFVCNSLEDMCDLMCDNYIKEAEEYKGKCVACVLDGAGACVRDAKEESEDEE